MGNFNITVRDQDGFVLADKAVEDIEFGTAICAADYLLDDVFGEVCDSEAFFIDHNKSRLTALDKRGDLLGTAMVREAL